MEKTIRASLDRFEGDYAVIYSDEDGRKFDVLRDKLENDAKPGMRLSLHLEGDHISTIEIEKKSTKDAKERIRKKYDRLRKGRHLQR